MKAVILAGGHGTRISEETTIKPKPMVEIGGKPILWHIMKLYSRHGIDEFVVLCGYKGYVIKEYFANYLLHQSSVTIDVVKNKIEIHHHDAEPWRVTLLDTGESTMTGGRLRRAAEHLNGETFCMTYGDGVADVDVTASIGFHREQGLAATLTAVQPPGRFGAFGLGAHQVRVEHFKEKPHGDEAGAWVNGGYFVLEPRVLDYIDGDTSIWERDPMERLARDGQLAAWRHGGFWQPMDTLRDKNYLEELWASGDAPWKVW